MTRPPFNVAIVILFVFAAIGLYWLSNLGIDAGDSYLRLLLIGLAFIIIVLIAKFVAKLDFWFEFPINKTEERGVLMLGLGLLVLIILVTISNVTNLNIHTAFAIQPLANFGTTNAVQSFNALLAVTSDFWSWFITVISAPVIEELVLGFCFVAMGGLIAFGIRKLLKFDLGSTNYIYDFIVAIFFSIILFSVFHFFNGSYHNIDGTWNINAFLYAATFRTILNILIYKFGNFGLLFSIGVHAAHNAWIIGWGVTKSALLSFPGGVLLIVIMLIFLLSIFLSIKKVVKEGYGVWNDLFTFE